MPNEAPFRIALAIIIVLTMSIGVYYRRRAASSGEKITYVEEGYLFAMFLRIAGLCLWLATFMYLLFPAAIRWTVMPLPLGVRWCGIVSGVLSAGLMYWTLSHLGKNLTDTVVTRANAELVTTGPYCWVRHPFYVTAALLMASATLLSANWGIGLASFLVMALLVLRTPKEEAMLVTRFGTAYRDYMKKTGRFLPRL